MLMPDVNILVYAHHAESKEHRRYAAWLSALTNGSEPFALSESVLHGFVRVVTNPRVFTTPSSLNRALSFADEVIHRPKCSLVRPGPDHWSIFRHLCKSRELKGKLVADAAHAALAIETGCEWVSADTDFARFEPDLRWRHL